MLDFLIGCALGCLIVVLLAFIRILWKDGSYTSEYELEALRGAIDRIAQLELENKELNKKLSDYAIKTTEHTNAIKELDRYIHEVL